MNKVLKKHKDLIIIMLFLSIVVVFMVLISLTYSFFAVKNTVKGEIVLGELDFQIISNTSIKEKIMPGDTVKIDLILYNNFPQKNNLIPFYFRFKLLTGDFDRNLIKTSFVENDYIQDNDYYYFKGKVNVNDSVNLIDSLTFDGKMSQIDAKIFDLQVQVEAVQSEYDAYKEIFYDAPTEWVELIENA